MAAPVPRPALRRARRYRAWSQDRAAAELHQLAGKLGEPKPGVDGNTVSRWERGTLSVSPGYTRLVTLLYEREAHDLGLEDPAPADLTEASELLALIEGIEGTDTSAGVVADTEAAVLRLRRAYSHTPPPILASQIDTRIRAVRQYLRGRLTWSQRRDLLAASYSHTSRNNNVGESCSIVRASRNSSSSFNSSVVGAGHPRYCAASRR